MDADRTTPSPDSEEESRRKAQENLIKQIMDMIFRMVRMITGVGRTSAAPGEVNQNLDSIQALSKDLEQYQNDALASGDPERAYLAANLQAGISALVDNKGNDKATSKQANDISKLAFSDMQEKMAGLEHDERFAEMFNRYDRHGKEHLEATMQKFTRDAVDLIEAKQFGSKQAPGILMQLANRFNHAAATRLQSRPLTAAERTGLEPMPELHPIADYRPEPADPAITPVPAPEHRPPSQSLGVE